MKIVIISAFVLLCTLNVFAQKNDSTHTHYGLYRGLSMHETELKSKRGVKNGEYKLFMGKKIIAQGLYKDDDRVGRWQFFNDNDTLDQVYNYSTKTVEYNLPHPKFTYYIDSIKEGDQVVYPAKVGGFLGIWLLTRYYNAPYEVQKGTGAYNLFFVFTVNENGELVKYETKIASSNYNKVDEIPLKKLRPEDLAFSPAKVNGKNIGCTLVYEVFVSHTKKYY